MAVVAGMIRALTLATALLALLAACGKVGPPHPPGPPDQLIYPKQYPPS